MSYNNTGSNKPTANTYGPSYKNRSVQKPSALSVNYWSDMLKLQFSPELPPHLQTPTRKYDHEHAISLSMQRARCMSLYSAYVKVIRPALDANEQKSVTIECPNGSQLTLDTNVKDGQCHPILKLSQNINPQTKIAADIVYYEFNLGSYIVDYMPETGVYSNVIPEHFELECFMTDLREMVNATSNAYLHAYKNGDLGWREATMTKLNRIGEKMGLQLDQKPQYGYNGGGGQGSLFDEPLPFEASSNPVPVRAQNVHSMEELDAAMQG